MTTARLPAQQTSLSNVSGKLTPEWFRALSTVAVNANNAEKLTLTGNVTFVGDYDTTITLTGDTDITFPESGTVASLNLRQTWTGTQSFENNALVLLGATSGALTLNAAAVTGVHTLTWPAGTTDFSVTGGASFVVKQTSSGAPFTVGQEAFSDISGTIASAQVSGAYTGITGVGTLTVGVWNATIISPTDGGTGVNNGTNELTVSSSTSVGQGQYLGSDADDNAAAGNIGEYFEPSLPLASAITLVSGTPATVISQVLGPGDYTVFGSVHFTAPGTSGTNWACAISGTDATLPTVVIGTITASNGPLATFNNSLGNTNSEQLTVGPGRVSVPDATTTTIYLVVQATFVGSAETAYGYMSIRRAR